MSVFGATIVGCIVGGLFLFLSDLCFSIAYIHKSIDSLTDAVRELNEIMRSIPDCGANMRNE